MANLPQGIYERLLDNDLQSILQLNPELSLHAQAQGRRLLRILFLRLGQMSSSSVRRCNLRFEISGQFCAVWHTESCTGAPAFGCGISNCRSGRNVIS